MATASRPNSKTPGSTSAPSTAPTGKTGKGPPSTVIWGDNLEKGDFLKVPRAMIYVRRYGGDLGVKLQPRHIHFMLALAARKYQKKMIRGYWLHLARDLGVSRHTVRKWAYEIRDLGLLH